MSASTIHTTKMPIGLRANWWAKITAEGESAHPTYSTPMSLGGSIKAYITVTTYTRQVAADDTWQINDDVFASATLEQETDCTDVELDATVFGHTLSEDGESTSAEMDSAPYGGWAGIEPLVLRDHSIVYRATVLYKIKAQQASEKMEADTLTPGNFTPKNKSITFMAERDATGAWRVQKEFPTFEAARTWIMGKFGVTGS